MGQALSAPVINDVATDTANPPTFTRSRHSPVLPDSVKKAIAGYYPDLCPLRVPARRVSEVLATVKKVAATALPRSSVVYESEAEGALELTDVTSLMKFTDDVAVRISPDGGSDGGGGVIVDMRSASRLGKGDLGCNAARIRKLLAALRQELQRGESRSSL